MLKGVLIAVALLIVGAGAYFLGKNGLSVSFNKANPAPFATTTPLPTQASSANQTSAPIATPSEEEALKAAVKAGLVAEHGQDATGMAITVSTIQDDYAKGMASEQGGGGIWFAAKVGGIWELVWDGNGIIQCSDLTPYPNFPTSLISECFDASTNKMVTR